MNEIRFRASEDQLYDELMRRREAHKIIGALHCPCTYCGRYTFVMPNATDRTSECEQCWAKRRYLELIDEV